MAGHSWIEESSEKHYSYERILFLWVVNIFDDKSQGLLRVRGIPIFSHNFFQTKEEKDSWLLNSSQKTFIINL